MSALTEIQKKLKAPKSNYNSFGKYNYRSCEDILEAVKPLLGDNTLTLSDEVVQIGDRIYVKATAVFRDGATETRVSAFAREAESKKGNDASQCTGSASTYARKYALCGLLGLDDSKAKAVSDPDVLAPSEHEEAKDTERQEILMEIYDMDITRKEVDDQIAVYYKGKDADTIELSRLRALLKYYQKTKKEN